LDPQQKQRLKILHEVDLFYSIGGDGEMLKGKNGLRFFFPRQ